MASSYFTPLTPGIGPLLESGFEIERSGVDSPLSTEVTKYCRPKKKKYQTGIKCYFGLVEKTVCWFLRWKNVVPFWFS
jgi:hypothetical protein